MARKSTPIPLGSKVGDWEILSEVRRPREIYYLCKCVCGCIREVSKSNLNLGKSTSCGKGQCKKLATTHGLTKHKLYSVWHNIRYRLKNPTEANSCYVGISLCKEWETFQEFYTWSINNGYREGLTIDRIDRNKGYSPDNCRWVDTLIQSQNRSHHKNSEIPYKGVFKRKPRNGQVIYKGTFKSPYYWIVIYNHTRHQKSGFSTPEEAYLDRCKFIKENYDGLVYPD